MSWGRNPCSRAERDGPPAFPEGDSVNPISVSTSPRRRDAVPSATIPPPSPRKARSSRGTLHSIPMMSSTTVRAAPRTPKPARPSPPPAAPAASNPPRSISCGPPSVSAFAAATRPIVPSVRRRTVALTPSSSTSLGTTRPLRTSPALRANSSPCVSTSGLPSRVTSRASETLKRSSRLQPAHATSTASISTL